MNVINYKVFTRILVELPLLDAGECAHANFRRDVRQNFFPFHLPADFGVIATFSCPVIVFNSNKNYTTLNYFYENVLLDKLIHYFN
jgi:hypothetical protein